jgi:flagellar protein FlaG
MAIKAVDPIADLSLAREVKLLQTQAARRNSQRPEPPNEAPAANTFPQQAKAQEAEQAQAEQNQQEAQAQTQARANPQEPSLRFHVDPDTGKTVAELVDHQGQVLRQVPTEEALEIAKAIGKMQGMFVDLKV